LSWRPDYYCSIKNDESQKTFKAKQKEKREKSAKPPVKDMTKDVCEEYKTEEDSGKTVIICKSRWTGAFSMKVSESAFHGC